MQRKLSLKTFCENVNKVPEAKAELLKWGLELDTDVMEVSRVSLNRQLFVTTNYYGLDIETIVTEACIKTVVCRPT